MQNGIISQTADKGVYKKLAQLIEYVQGNNDFNQELVAAFVNQVILSSIQNKIIELDFISSSSAPEALSTKDLTAFDEAVLKKWGEIAGINKPENKSGSPEAVTFHPNASQDMSYEGTGGGEAYEYWFKMVTKGEIIFNASGESQFTNGNSSSTGSEQEQKRPIVRKDSVTDLARKFEQKILAHFESQSPTTKPRLK